MIMQEDEIEVKAALTEHVGLIWKALLTAGVINHTQFLDLMNAAAKSFSLDVGRDVAKAFATSAAFLPPELMNHPSLKG
ncbi:MAG: hypothetical protein ACR652_23105 [Methylocystis sp.]|uniref:hypothetical protein n=1 Tax=Methylocystis sp. TaxID=1911079 RepID=UPI003DA5C6FD